MAEKLKLTRSQIAAWVGDDPESIRQVERLFRSLGDIDSTTIAELAVQAGTADAKANSALAQLTRIADALELLSTAPVQEPPQAYDDLSPRTEPYDTLNALRDTDTAGAATGDVLTYSGSQWEASGSITASLTNDTARLMDSSVTLNNGAGASTGTLMNAPSVGNPTKWLEIDDNGTTRHIPAW